MMRVQVVCKRQDAAASVALEITAINIQASHDFLYGRPGQAAVFRGMRDVPIAALQNTLYELPLETIEKIRRLRIKGCSYSQIASLTNVSIGHCWQVVNNLSRKDR